MQIELFWSSISFLKNTVYDFSLLQVIFQKF